MKIVLLACMVTMFACAQSVAVKAGPLDGCNNEMNDCGEDDTGTLCAQANIVTMHANNTIFILFPLLLTQALIIATLFRTAPISARVWDPNAVCPQPAKAVAPDLQLVATEA